jgi:DNA-directed RNA polymerase subunit N (RpoN/RPB10)
MIIPIRCFTCNKVIAHLWEDYLDKIQMAYLDEDISNNKKTSSVNHFECLQSRSLNSSNSRRCLSNKKSFLNYFKL